jgi:hypothetical protein
MKIQVNFGNIAYSGVLDERIREEITDGLGRFAERITRVEVHLADLNGPRGGDDKRVLIEARLAGDKPFVVEEVGDDIYDVVVAAAGKLARATKRRLGRRGGRAA